MIQASSEQPLQTRRRFVAYFSGIGLSSTLLPGVLWAKLQEKPTPAITLDMVKDAARLAGLDFTTEECEMLVDDVNKNLTRFETMRQTHLDNSVPPPLYFNPLVAGMTVDRTKRPFRPSKSPVVSRPANLEDVAFWPLTHLAQLIRTRQVRSVDLTEMYLGRLKRFNPKLNCLVTLTDDRAMKQARQADSDIAAGRYRGPVHGIPWGAKDIIAAKGYPTTWGAEPLKDQVINHDATVVERLDQAGAVLVAKLTTGELAFGDNWFGGRTNNPWNSEEGSSGSSAGSAAATAAGLVGFAIGTDTGGSILSPSLRCGVVSLRPTFGRVSRYGVMAAGFSLDKIGPMCRMVEDCAIVLHAIAGPDGKDLSVPHDVPFNWEAAQEVPKLRVGYFGEGFENEKREEWKANGLRSLDALRSIGFELRRVELPTNDLNYFIEYIERSAGFDEFARARKDEHLRRQRHRAELRYSHLVPAVEYLQANRIRMLLMQQVAHVMSDVDVVVATYESINPLTSMTGHPVVAVPNGFTTNGTPTGITFVGQIYKEAELLAVARAYQNATDFHTKHPPLGSVA